MVARSPNIVVQRDAANLASGLQSSQPADKKHPADRSVECDASQRRDGAVTAEEPCDDVRAHAAPVRPLRAILDFDKGRLLGSEFLDERTLPPAAVP